MKKLLIILITLTPLIISCTRKAALQTIPLNNEITVKDHLYPVAIAPDSSYIQLLLACDSLNQVYLKEITESKGKKVETSFSLKDNKLQYKAKFIHDTLYVRGKDSIVRSEIPVPVSTPVFINQLKWWQKTLMWAGGVLLVYVMYLVLKFIAKLRSGSR